MLSGASTPVPVPQPPRPLSYGLCVSISLSVSLLWGRVSYGSQGRNRETADRGESVWKEEVLWFGDQARPPAHSPGRSSPGRHQGFPEAPRALSAQLPSLTVCPKTQAHLGHSAAMEAPAPWACCIQTSPNPIGTVALVQWRVCPCSSLTSPMTWES